MSGITTLREALQALRLIVWASAIPEENHPAMKRAMAVMETEVGIADHQQAEIAALKTLLAEFIDAYELEAGSGCEDAPDGLVYRARQVLGERDRE